jgi:hypothetical protein
MVEKAVQHGFVPSTVRVRRQPEDHTTSEASAEAQVPALFSCAVDIPVWIEGQPVDWRTSIAASREMVDHFLFSASVGLGYQLENGANSMKAAADCRAVEIPKPVENQASGGLVLVVAAAEGV